MKRRRPTALFLLLALGGLAAAAGCARRVISPTPDSAAAAESNSAAPDMAAADGSPYHFPDDAGGALLAKVLPPAEGNGPLNGPAVGPRRLPPAPGLDAPPLTLTPSLAPPPSVPAERNRPQPQPRLVVEETLGLGRTDPEPPRPRSFVVADRVRLPAEDVNKPAPLPILAQPTADRASLDDPTVDASAAAVVAAAMPHRTNPVSYFRVTLPDPFANRQALRLPLPPDDAGPRTGTVHPPKP